MSFKRIIIFIQFLSLFFFSFSRILFCDLQKKQAQESLKHEVNVVLKLVQVYATDKGGRPIIDLDESDFLLYDNGQKQEITEFEKYVLSGPGFKAVHASRKAADKERGRNFFLFFDFAFNNRRGIKEIQEAALHFIDTALKETDKVGILSYEANKGLALHQNLSLDHAKAREIVKGFGLHMATGIVEPKSPISPQNIDLPEELSSEGGEVKEGKNVDIQKIKNPWKWEQERIYAQQFYSFNLELNDLAKSLDYIPGLKHIIFFSWGADPKLLLNLTKPSWETASDHRILRRFFEMTKQLASANCQVYTVDTNFMAPMEKRRDSLINDTLQEMASMTGGKHFMNIGHYKEIMKYINNATSSYYILGYYINEKWDGKYHKIKVRVKRKGCDVRFQGGYFNPKLFEKYDRVDKKLHLMDLALTRDLSSLPLIPVKTLHSHITGNSVITIISKINMDEIREVAGNKTEITSFIFDRQNNVLDFEKGEINFHRLKKGPIYQYTTPMLLPGSYRYRLILRNLKTGDSAVAAASIIVPSRTPKHLDLSQPLILIPEENSLFLRGIRTKSKDEDKPISTLLFIYPFNAAKYAPLVGSMPEGIKEFLVISRCGLLKDEKADLKLNAWIEDKVTGEEILATVWAANQARNGTEIFIIKFLTQGLEPGAYMLWITVKEAKGNRVSSIDADFNVK